MSRQNFEKDHHHIPYYKNIEWYINQREFGSYNANLSRANKSTV